jgi:hypothetical protein
MADCRMSRRYEAHVGDGGELAGGGVDLGVVVEVSGYGRAGSEQASQSSRGDGGPRPARSRNLLHEAAVHHGDYAVEAMA